MLTFHKHPKQSDAREFIRHECDLHEFIGMLRIAARTPLMKKDELFLWNPAIYDPSRGNGYRTQANFIRTYFLVLDFDGGTLSPEQFVDIYWNKAPRGQKHSLVICNSFSRCPEMPNKYRVIFPYLHAATSIAAHKAAYAYVARRLRNYGHSEQSAKLDSACKSGIQSFWMPCTNREFPEWAFFRTYGTKTVQLAKCAIDPQL